MGAALVQGNSKTENNISSYSCYIYSYQHPSDNTTELPVVRATCTFEPAYKPAKKSNQERLILDLIKDGFNNKANANFLSRLESKNFSTKNITRDDLSEMFDGFTPALTLSEDLHHLDKSVKNCPESNRKRGFNCSVNNVIKPKKKYPEDGDIYDFKCQAQEVDKQKIHEKYSVLHLDEKDERVKEFLKNDFEFQKSHLTPSMQEADVNFLNNICKNLPECNELPSKQTMTLALNKIDPIE